MCVCVCVCVCIHIPLTMNISKIHTNNTEYVEQLIILTCILMFVCTKTHVEKMYSTHMDTGLSMRL